MATRYRDERPHIVVSRAERGQTELELRVVELQQKAVDGIAVQSRTGEGTPVHQVIVERDDIEAFIDAVRDCAEEVDE